MTKEKIIEKWQKEVEFLKSQLQRSELIKCTIMQYNGTCVYAVQV